MSSGLDPRPGRGDGAKILSVGSLPPRVGGPAFGGVATVHATLLEGFLDSRSPMEVVGAVSPAPAGNLPTQVFSRPSGEPMATFYERLLAELEPDVVIMHHFAHTIGLTHARLSDSPPAIGVAHSWHNITFSSGEERRRAVGVTEEALSGLSALVGVSRHCLCEGEALGLCYPPLVTMIYPPLQDLYSSEFEPDALMRERRGIACLGSLIPRKDQTVLVEAAALLPGLAVELAGHGESEGSLRSLISSLSLGDRVAIRDLDDGRTRDLLLGSEAMCLPSRSETFGLAYIEALACGAPVVGFGPTLREIRTQMGIEIGEPLDEVRPERVAAAIESIRATVWNRDELRRRTVEAFSPKVVIDRYEALIEQVVAGRRGAPAPAGRSSDRAPTVVCILGMSRAGTSLTARILNLAGVYLGADDELLGGELRQLAGEGEEVVARARAANPGGFWEHYRLMRLNERILRELGGSWRQPPSLDPGWEESKMFDSLREEARALLAESFAGQVLWGWKDPRNSLTLPFWQRLLPDMRYVICLRDPAEVASSLNRRDGLSREDGIELWLRYFAAALINTSSRPRLIVPYERYFEDPVGTIARLARFVGRDDVLNGATGVRGLTELIDARLWRNRGGARAPLAVASLFRVGELLATMGDGDARSERRDARLHAAADRYAKGLLPAAMREPAAPRR